jgi:hypothetical protein
LSGDASLHHDTTPSRIASTAPGAAGDRRLVASLEEAGHLARCYEQHPFLPREAGGLTRRRSPRHLLTQHLNGDGYFNRSLGFAGGPKWQVPEHRPSLYFGFNFVGRFVNTMTGGGFVSTGGRLVNTTNMGSFVPTGGLFVTADGAFV